MNPANPVRGIFSWVVIVAFAHSGPAASADTGVTNAVPIFSQTIVFKLPKGWIPGHENASQSSYILEFIPQGQTVQAWREMVTVQGYRDLAQNPKAAPSAFLAVIAAGLKKICGEELIVQFLGDRKVDSYDAYAAIMGCPRLPVDAYGAKAGQGEIAYYLAIKGSNDLYVVQRAVRGNAFDKGKAPILPSNADEFMRPLQPIKICDRSESKGQCWGRPSR
jgi:hypothetical protein